MGEEAENIVGPPGHSRPGTGSRLTQGSSAARSPTPLSTSVRSFRGGVGGGYDGETSISDTTAPPPLLLSSP